MLRVYQYSVQNLSATNCSYDQRVERKRGKGLRSKFSYTWILNHKNPSLAVFYYQLIDDKYKYMYTTGIWGISISQIRQNAHGNPLEV